MAFIEASLEELPVSANLGQSCLATKISAPGPSNLGWFRHKVGRGEVLTPPLDRTGIDLPPSSARRHIRPPPIRGPIEVHAYTDSDDDDGEEEEEEPNDVASLREQLAALRLRLNNMDERVAEAEIDRKELGDRVDTLCKAVCSKIKQTKVSIKVTKV